MRKVGAWTVALGAAFIVISTFARDRAAACTVDAAVLALRTPLEAPIPTDGGLLFDLVPYGPGVPAPPAADALALVRGDERIPFRREERDRGAVYLPSSEPAPGEWTLEGWGEPRSLVFATRERIEAPDSVSVRVWESGPRFDVWHQRVAWDAVPSGVARIELSWRFGERSWERSVDAAERSVHLHGRIDSGHAQTWWTGCPGLRAPQRLAIERGDIAQARWIDVYGRASAWSHTIRVGGER